MIYLINLIWTTNHFYVIIFVLVLYNPLNSLIVPEPLNTYCLVSFLLVESDTVVLNSLKCNFKTLLYIQCHSSRKNLKAIYSVKASENCRTTSIEDETRDTVVSHTFRTNLRTALGQTSEHRYILSIRTDFRTQWHHIHWGWTWDHWSILLMFYNLEVLF